MILRAVIVMVLLSISACGEHRPFDQAAWKSEAGLPSPPYEAARPAMLADIKRRLPVGTDEVKVRQLLGPSEHDFPDICREEPRADYCLFYAGGVSGTDQYDIVIAFKNGRLLSYRLREL